MDINSCGSSVWIAAQRVETCAPHVTFIYGSCFFLLICANFVDLSHSKWWIRAQAVAIVATESIRGWSIANLSSDRGGSCLCPSCTSNVFFYSWLAHNAMFMRKWLWYRCHTLKVSTKTTCCISSHRSLRSNLGLGVPSKCWLKKLSVDSLWLEF